MLGQQSIIQPGVVQVRTTNGKGQDINDIVESCLQRIVGVSDNAEPVIREQAEAFKNDIRAVLKHYMMEAVRSERTTTYNLLKQNGYEKMAELLRSM